MYTIDCSKGGTLAKKKKVKTSSKPQVVYVQKKSNMSWTIALIVVSGLVSLILILAVVDMLKNKNNTSGGANQQNQQQSVDNEQAIQGYLNQLSQNPNDVNTLIQLGNLYYDSSKWTQATEYYEKALKIEPNNPNVITDMGTAYWYSNQSNPEMAKKAIELYDRAIKFQPNFQNAILNKGIVLRDGLKKPKEALAVWNEYLKIPGAKETGRVKSFIEDTKNNFKN